MNSDLQSLRDRALNRTVNSLHREALCLDEDAAAQIQKLERGLAQLREKRAAELEKIKEGDGDARMAVNPVAEVDALIADAEADLQRQRDAAEAETVVLVFGRLKPADYDALLDEYSKDDSLDLTGFQLALAERTYRRAETLTGEDIEIPWGEVIGSVLSHGDRDQVCINVVAHNRRAVVIPFSKRS